MQETHKRTLARMVSYRLTAWLLTIVFTFAYSGNLGPATTFATFLHVLLSLDYYVHERLWLRVKWGLRP